MPRQETFLRENIGSVTIEVTKIYDLGYAKEVFDGMDDNAKKALAQALELTDNYEAEDIPNPNDSDYDAFLWDELSEASVEDVRQSPRQYSFFVVSVGKDGRSQDRYISADWPSAEQFAASLSGRA